MPYTVNWYIENEIIYSRYSGVITAEELANCLTTVKTLMENSPRNLVHAITDVGDVTQPVALKDSIRVVRQVGSSKHSGWTLTIREKSILVKMSAGMGASIFKTRFRAFDTLDQALAHLKAIDEDLSWDKVDTSVVGIKL